MAKFTEWDRGPYLDDREFDDTPPSTPPPSPAPTSLPDAPDDFGTFSPPSFGGAWSPSFNFRPVPQFNPSRFRPPSFEDAQNEPGYRFRLDSGTDALERSAAARGVLRGGNTLTDIVEYGQNFGAQEYANVFNRALQSYGADYQRERDMFAPQYGEWQFLSGAEQQAAMAAFDRAWDQYALDWEAAQRNEDRILQTMLSGNPPPDPGF